jgi:hypothetical protein
VSVFDLLALFPFGPPSRRGQSYTPAQNAISALGMAVLPFLLFLVVLMTGVHRNSEVSLLVLPLGSTAATAIACRLSRQPLGWSIAVLVGTFGLCFLTAGIAYLMAVFFSFYSGF